MDTIRGDVTRLLEQVAHGDLDAEARLVRLVYAELKSVAKNKLRRQAGKDGTLTPTVLVHEAYVRVFRGNGNPLQNRRHLFFAFAQAMWRILVEHQRRKHVDRRDAVLGDLAGCVQALKEDVLDLNEALLSFRRSHPREYEIVLLRKMLGFSIAHTAELLETSPATVKRGWAYAKAELSRSLARGHDP
jgi:RNA polymerase sigma factor (TIGR02999 family)